MLFVIVMSSAMHDSRRGSMSCFPSNQDTAWNR